ncbi:MAG TPA: pantoate--beta-alanine ligase, partial [Bacillales bacterium]|nr:pantoate--beta-alanine ligase [Bacillales bacterium]
MKVVTSIREMQQCMASEKKNGKSVGFVPTMGFLHEGHLSLANRSVRENDVTVMSVFINPLQFAPGEDFERYPRAFDNDRLEAEAAGVDYLFYPSKEEMYPGESAFALKVVKRTDVLCGKSRPGHFDGVATVLTKMFHIVMPDRVYFGMKDAQQAAVVEGLIDDFNFPVELIRCETVREQDGLAKSSRNVNLSESERREAPVLYKSLRYGHSLLESGERNTERLREEVLRYLQEHLRDGAVEYVDVLTYPKLNHVSRVEGKIIMALAVKYDAARLIDNLVWQEGEA